MINKTVQLRMKTGIYTMIRTSSTNSPMSNK